MLSSVNTGRTRVPTFTNRHISPDTARFVSSTVGGHTLLTKSQNSYRSASNNVLQIYDNTNDEKFLLQIQKVSRIRRMSLTLKSHQFFEDAQIKSFLHIFAEKSILIHRNSCCTSVEFSLARICRTLTDANFKLCERTWRFIFIHTRSCRYYNCEPITPESENRNTANLIKRADEYYRGSVT